MSNSDQSLKSELAKRLPKEILADPTDTRKYCKKFSFADQRLHESDMQH